MAQKPQETIPVKAGDVLYFVLEYDGPDDDTKHTWEIEERRVIQARRDGIVFEHHRGLPAKRHPLRTIGTHFHRTPADAINAFRAQQTECIESAQHKTREAERTLVWAESQLW